MNPETMFAYIFVVGLLGVVLNAGVIRLTNSVWPTLQRVQSA
jgi:ABC-type nitrate/sulfonate/bicarbonate transport system permease component